MRIPAIQLIPLRQAVCSDRPTTLDLLIKITPPPPEQALERPRLNLGLVLDRSGSMSGQKIEYARQAAMFAVDHLLPTDRVSLTIYDDKIETIAPSMLVENKALLKGQIQQVTARGSTALHGGWVQGGIQVSQHFNPQQLNRVILLSDGLANVGETNADTIASDVHGLARRGVSTTTMGIGDDYNEDLLTAMARSGDGNYYYIQSPQQLPHIFGLELQGLMATMGAEVTLEIHPQSGVALAEVLNRLEITANEQYRLPNLLFEQPLLVVVRLKVPPLATASDISHVQLSWHDPQDKQRGVAQASLRLPVVLAAQLSDFPLNEEVQQQVALLMAAKAREEAVRLSDQGDYMGAGKVLRQARLEIQESPNLPLAAVEADALNDLEAELGSGSVARFRKMSTHSAYSRHQSSGLTDLFYRFDRGPRRGDITQVAVEAIVNSVGPDFILHGPLSQAIQRAAGPGLLTECQQLGTCGFGEARLTQGYNLPAKWVIHTVPPHWQGGQAGEATMLAQCYRSCLALAGQRSLQSIAFPALGTGNLGFPLDKAAEIAFQETATFLMRSSRVGKVIFVCYEEAVFNEFTRVFRKIGGGS